MSQPAPERVDATARAAIASAADAVVAVDRDLRVLLWNPAAERLFGWTADEVVGQPLPIVPDELLAERDAMFERVRLAGSLSLVTRWRHRDGTLLDIRSDTSCLAGDNGEPSGWVMIHRAVAEEQAIRASSAERARLVKRLTDILGDINTDLDLPAVLDRISDSLVEVTGADAGGFIRIDGDQLTVVSLTRLSERMRGARVPLRSNLVGRLLRSDRTIMLDSADSGPLVSRFREEMPGLHTVALTLSYVHGRAYGAMFGLFGSREVGHVELELLELLAGHAGVAITNAMAYEEVVRQRAHERAVIDASADGIAVLDRDGNVCQWNPAAYALTSSAAADVFGKPPPFPVPEPGTTVTFQMPTGCWLEVLCTRIAETGELVCDFRDVTAAKELEEAKDLFLATASHELRTPITVVRGFASTLVNRWDSLDDGQRRASVETIAGRAHGLSRLVDQVLLGSRVGAEELPVSNTEFDLGAVLEAAVRAFQPLSQRHAVRLDMPDRLPSAYGDATAADVVISQLLENAIKYSPDGGAVTVRAHTEDPWIVVAVEDEGVGIPLGEQEHIFERFVQGEGGDRRRFGGIGLGLFIARRLARAQQGEVSAHGRQEGGTEMRFVLSYVEASGSQDTGPGK